MKTIIWRASLKEAPAALRYCKRCGVKTAFRSSGLFRVNAQQKSLDVWLVYKCSQCDSTWKLSVLSRVPPRSIPPELLRGFFGNDRDLALRYAADTALLKQNGAEPEQPEIGIIGPETTLANVDVPPGEPLRIRLIAEQPLAVRAEAILRGKLGLSRSEFERMLSIRRLVCVSGHDLKKARLSGEIIVELR